MKTTFLCFIILVFCNCVLAQKPINSTNNLEIPELVLSGTVKEIAAQERIPNTQSAFYLVYVEMELTLKNNGTIPVIFLQPNPIVWDAFIKKQDYLVEGTSSDILAQTPGFRTSFAMFSDDWKKMKKNLDKPTPPPNKTTILQPNQEIKFNSFARFNIPKFQDESFTIGVVPSQNLSLLQKLSPLQITLDCETWTTLPLIINKKSGESLKVEFAKNLQNKWKNYGYLWFEHIDSQPISIDFNSVIFKTLID